MNRKTFLKSLFGLAGVGLVSGLYTWQVEPFWLEFVHKKMPIKNLPPHLEGKILMQISDIHVGYRVDDNFLIDSFKKAQAFEPDFVVYTGDYVSYKNHKQIAQLQEVFQKCVKGKSATLGILGNHDYGKKWAEPQVANDISYVLEKAGIRMLRNEKVEVDGLHIIGIDDYWGTNYKPRKAMREYDKNKANIVLCHNPDACDEHFWGDYQGWILAGHTHGGQCKPPFLPPPVVPVKNRKYTAGEIDLEDGRILYINRALGHSWKVRFNVRPEITIFELLKA